MDSLTRQISSFAASLAFNDLTQDLVAATQQRIVDTLACMLGARDCDAVRMTRALSEGATPKRWPGRVVSRTERTTSESAAFANSLMGRYLDYNDTGPGSHPSDCIGGFLAIAEAAQADGQRLLSAVVVAYETIIRLAFGTKFRQRGWDQGFATAVGTAAGAAHLLRLSVPATASAVAIAAVANVPLRASRAGQLSLWKAAATPFAVKNGIEAALLAAEGMTGPEQPFEGRFGLWEQITGPFQLEAFPTEGGPFLLPRWSRLKYWPVEYNAQIAVWAARDLRAQLTADQIERVEISTYHQAWHEIGSEPEKWSPTTRETADHSLPYIFARALTDGAISIRSFDEAAFLDPDIRMLMSRVSVRSDEAFTARFPAEIPIRIEAISKDGQHVTIELSNPRGHNLNPCNAADIEAKFRSFADELLGINQARQALDAWWALARHPVLTPLLDLLNPTSTHCE
jgi:2-methylcitrate dehydratase